MKAQESAGVFLHKPRWKKNLEFFIGIQVPWKKLMLPGGIVLVAAVIGAGIYFGARYKDRDSEVAGSSTNELPKEWLVKYFQTENENDERVKGANGDPDDDILTNVQEYLYGTDPTKEDTDGDGDIDSYEIAYNQNPNGDNFLTPTIQAQDYLKQVIEGSEEYSQFSEANIAEYVNSVIKPDQAIVLDLPEDAELIISRNNDPQAFEQYFEDVKGLMTATEEDYQNITTRLFDGMTDEEIDAFIDKLRAKENVLKQIAVPSQIAEIQKLKIAGLRATIGLFELVRDRYVPGNETPELWTDMFNRIIAIRTANDLELAIWNDLGNNLKDTGGWEELK